MCSYPVKYSTLLTEQSRHKSRVFGRCRHAVIGLGRLARWAAPYEAGCTRMERSKERQDGTSATEMLDQRKVGSVYRGRDLISKHYKLGPELGRGAFAVVRCASSRANKRWWQSESLKSLPSGKDQNLTSQIPTQALCCQARQQGVPHVQHGSAREGGCHPQGHRTPSLHATLWCVNLRAVETVSCF